MSSTTIIVIRSSYTEAQKRASYKWRAANPQKVRESRMKQYYRQKETNQPLWELSTLIDAASFREYTPPRPRGRPKKVM